MLSTVGYDAGVVFKKLSTVLRSSPASIPRTTSPLALNSRLMFSRAGMAWRHGPHQLAQKSSSTGFPLSDDRLYGVPSSAFTSNAGAFLPERSALGRTFIAKVVTS